MEEGLSRHWTNLPLNFASVYSDAYNPTRPLGRDSEFNDLAINGRGERIPDCYFPAKTLNKLARKRSEIRPLAQWLAQSGAQKQASL